MFDQQSANLLQSAPEVFGILPEDLPRLLTEVYTELVTNRLKNENTNSASVRRLMEIANSYEAVTSLVDGENARKASAFVAGSAYQILTKTLDGLNEQYTQLLSRDHINGQIAAALLFLIAEQYPDAKEAINQLDISRDNDPLVLQMLSESLRDLVLERFESITARAGRRERSQGGRSFDLQTRAMLHLYELILQGIELLASIILNIERPAIISNTVQSPNDLFGLVLNMATQQFTNVPFTGGFLSTYPGPAHLASLLLKTADSLGNASIMLVSPPDGVNETMWTDWLNYRAKSKPILWPNHRAAIQEGFHKSGISAVVVLPTGAGKTTLSEFKIATALASGKKVIFLAPTNALVEQLKVDLREALPDGLFGDDEFYEADLFTTVNEALPALEVMTPEKCLAILNFNPLAFSEVGLLVFDECHSLSPDSGSLRRAIDGMLVILNLQYHVPSIDFLFLSAMIDNVEEFAEWVANLTGKTCLPIDMIWKPSRQARGIVLYPESELQSALAAANNAQQRGDHSKRTRSKDVRTAASALVRATPHALFGLINNWHPDSPEDVKIQKLSTSPYQLDSKFGSSRQIQATPSGNDVSRNLAVSCALAGLKTIVFINNAYWTYSSARKISPAITGTITYNDHERLLWRSIEIEFGNPMCSMLYELRQAVPHNANLINLERQLAESLFKRPDGAKVIFATTTLSQGMNLPAQVAILSADERAAIDGNSITQEPLKAHELLNAAGRAGRAGYLANGLVILVPRIMLTFSGTTPEPQALQTLSSIVPENERCVTMTDPLQRVLDLIQAGETLQPDITYVFHRLLQDRTNSEHADDTFKRSFASYRASKNGQTEAFLNQVESFKSALSTLPDTADMPGWLTLIAMQSGISPAIMLALYQAVKDNFNNLPHTIEDWTAWLIKWFENHVEAGRYCFGDDLQLLKSISSLKSIHSGNYDAALGVLRVGIVNWLKGASLSEIEINMGGSLKGIGMLCPKAREIATNIAPRAFSFFSSFLVQITQQVSHELNQPIQYPAVLECLPAAISKGFDQPAKLAFYQIIKNRYLSRVETHRRYNIQYASLEFSADDDYRTISGTIRNMQ